MKAIAFKAVVELGLALVAKAGCLGHKQAGGEVQGGVSERQVFERIRRMCLREPGRLAEGAESFAASARLSPGTRSYQQMAVALGRNLGTGKRSADGKSASIQRDASHSKL
jgi:hypothetical protein